VRIMRHQNGGSFCRMAAVSGRCVRSRIIREVPVTGWCSPGHWVMAGTGMPGAPAERTVRVRRRSEARIAEIKSQ